MSFEIVIPMGTLFNVKDALIRVNGVLEGLTLTHVIPGTRIHVSVNTLPRQSCVADTKAYANLDFESPVPMKDIYQVRLEFETEQPMVFYSLKISNDSIQHADTGIANPHKPGEGFWICDIHTEPLLVLESFETMKKHYNAWIDSRDCEKIYFDERFKDAKNLSNEVFLATKRQYFAKAM